MQLTYYQQPKRLENKMKKLIINSLLIVLGVTAGYLGQDYIKQNISLLTGNTTQNEATKKVEKKVLYWVAPMDPNYRKDKPGKSMMGMDLLPVYEEEKPKEREILYWYAPMDKNYRRDKPGKSMMGMDLLPFYKEDNAQKGVVKISPTVQNNFGVRFAKVIKGDFYRNISTVGYISLDENKIAQINTRVEGWIEKLSIKESGALVKKGQKLFEIYSPSLVNAQEELLSALQSKNKFLVKASKEKLISLGLNKKQIKRLEQRNKVKQRINYYAPQSGFIERLNIREGVYIKPATNIMSIASIDTVWVIAEVFESQSGLVKKGQQVTMQTKSYPSKTWKGTVDFIYPVLDKRTRTLKVRIKFDNKAHLLKPNMFASLTIKDQFDKNTLFVKREAIIRTGTMEKVVKSLGEGLFLSVAVKTGAESGQYIEVLKGLKEGDEIVTSAQFLIDSESSLTASFERMDYDNNTNPNVLANNQVWVVAKVIKIDRKQHLLKLDHEAIKDWDEPAMFMDINAIDSVNLNIEENQTYHFLFERTDNGVKVVDIKTGDNQ